MDLHQPFFWHRAEEKGKRRAGIGSWGKSVAESTPSPSCPLPDTPLFLPLSAPFLSLSTPTTLPALLQAANSGSRLPALPKAAAIQHWPPGARRMHCCASVDHCGTSVLLPPRNVNVHWTEKNTRHTMPHYLVEFAATSKEDFESPIRRLNLSNVVNYMEPPCSGPVYLKRSVGRAGCFHASFMSAPEASGIHRRKERVGFCKPLVWCNGAFLMWLICALPQLWQGSHSLNTGSHQIPTFRATCGDQLEVAGSHFTAALLMPH